MSTRLRSSKIAVAAKYAGFALRTIRRQGLGHGVAEFASECWFDLRRGTDTLRPREIREGLSAGSAADAVQYQGASPRLVRRLLESLPLEAKSGTLLDYGCGKGRVLLLAAEGGFAKIIGVEFDPALIDVARRNLNRHFTTDVPAIELHAADAVLFEPPSGPLTVFLYNPFGGDTLRRVVRRLADRIRTSADPMWIVYVNPVGLAEFTEAGFVVERVESRRSQTAAAVLSPVSAGRFL